MGIDGIYGDRGKAYRKRMDRQVVRVMTEGEINATTGIIGYRTELHERCTFPGVSGYLCEILRTFKVRYGNIHNRYLKTAVYRIVCGV